MFLRFTKGQFVSNNKRLYRKCIFLGDSLVMEYGDKIVGAAKLHEETSKYFDYNVIVANKCEIGGEKIARYIKDMIGKSNKFVDNPSKKRRKYYTDYVECEYLPIKASIKFSKC